MELETLRIRSGPPLHGTAPVSGSKNAALPIMAACLLSEEAVRLQNVPHLSDVETLAETSDHRGFCRPDP